MKAKLHLEMLVVIARTGFRSSVGANLTGSFQRVPRFAGFNKNKI
jgi:hypothetical protein